MLEDYLKETQENRGIYMNGHQIVRTVMYFLNAYVL